MVHNSFVLYNIFAIFSQNIWDNVNINATNEETKSYTNLLQRSTCKSPQTSLRNPMVTNSSKVLFVFFCVFVGSTLVPWLD